MGERGSSNENTQVKNEPELTFKIGQWIWKGARATADIAQKVSLFDDGLNKTTNKKPPRGRLSDQILELKTSGRQSRASW
jgi:hypothetical protein